MTDEKPTETTPAPTPSDTAAQVAADRAKLKAENDAYEAEMVRAERLRAERVRAGHSVVVPAAPVQTQEDKIKEILKERWKDSKRKPYD